MSDDALRASLSELVASEGWTRLCEYAASEWGVVRVLERVEAGLTKDPGDLGLLWTHAMKPVTERQAVNRLLSYPAAMIAKLDAKAELKDAPVTPRRA